jgi:hypothetical protein
MGPRSGRINPLRLIHHQRIDPLGHFAHRDDGLHGHAGGIDGGDRPDRGVGDVDRLAVGVNVTQLGTEAIGPRPGSLSAGKATSPMSLRSASE